MGQVRILNMSIIFKYTRWASPPLARHAHQPPMYIAIPIDIVKQSLFSSQPQTELFNIFILDHFPIPYC